MADAPKINVSLKLDGQKPWVTVYGDSAEELAFHLEQISNNGIGAKAGAALGSLMAGFEAGHQLGAEHVATVPVQQVQAAPQQQFPAPAQYAPPQQYSAPAPQAAPAAPPAPGMAQGPLVLGQPAKLIQSKPGAPRAWSAWADPPPKSLTEHITEKTADPNDPRLAAGTATFWQFIR